MTCALVALCYSGWKIAGLPFAPFDIFDWIVRHLPGVLVTTAIDGTVALSRTLGVTNISAAAKTGDQALAIVLLLGVGAIAGAVLFALLAMSDEPALLFGAILGGMLGGLSLIAERQLQRLPQGSVAAGTWVFATFLVWGVAFGWIHENWKVCTADDADDTARSRHIPRRRRFLRVLAGASVLVSAGSTIVGLIAARLETRVLGRRWSDDHLMPNADDEVSPVAGTRPEFTPVESFYRIDTDTRAPSLDPTRWRLTIGGLVGRAQTMTLDELRSLGSIDVFATLCCISNPPGGDLISTTRWSGVSLQRLLTRVAVEPSATHFKITSADGFFEFVAIDTIRSDDRVMLAYAWDGVPLPVEHGYPLRLYVPDVYGMKQPKWVVGVEAVAGWQPGYWVVRGWSKEGTVSPTSAIDIAEVNAHAGHLELGGIAFAGARGISKVEVRSDGGDWHAARLRHPLSDLTWVVWRATLPIDPGSHVMTVRTFDSAGQPQDGPLHSRRVRV